MTVRGDLIDAESDLFFASFFSDDARRQARSLTFSYDHAAAKIRQREGADAVAAVNGTDQGEQRGVLTDRQQLTVAEQGPIGSEVVRYQRKRSQKSFLGGCSDCETTEEQQ